MHTSTQQITCDLRARFFELLGTQGNIDVTNDNLMRAVMETLCKLIIPENSEWCLFRKTQTECLVWGPKPWGYQQSCDKLLFGKDMKTALQQHI